MPGWDIFKKSFTDCNDVTFKNICKFITKFFCHLNGIRSNVSVDLSIFACDIMIYLSINNNLYRSLEVHTKFSKYKDAVRSEWTSLDNYLLNDLFEIPYNTLPNGLKTVKKDDRCKSGV